MQLFIDSYGSYLGVKDGMFLVRTKNSEAPVQFAVRSIRAIYLTKGVVVSTGALWLALKCQIPVLLLNSIGQAEGQVWSGQFGSIATIRKNQALFCTHPDALIWLQHLMMQKIKHQLELLYKFEKSEDCPREFKDQFTLSQKILINMENRFKQWKYFSFPEENNWEKTLATFRGWEGNASKYYFKSLATLLPAEFAYTNRSRNPAIDPFNSLLNYLYGMTYSMVYLALIQAGIDPYCGILHADEYNKPTMTYDFVEIYRQWADETAIMLCRNGRLDAGLDFDHSETEGVRLNGRSKNVVISSFLNFTEQMVFYKKQNRKRITHIQMDAYRFATMLKQFKPEHQDLD
ncbi:MAG: CRISPR-associated endonuclease Cas1 [Sphingobacteriales bacterium]|nr:MAG: CRISPR-associated endonuclease Cas1 [Sphingobacteriales bacterium]